MSWSFSAIGKAAAVAKKARADLERIKCAEPEETIKAGVIAMIEATCSAMPEASAVKIVASGSQSTAYVDNKPADGKYTNNLRLDIEPIWGFVE